MLKQTNQKDLEFLKKLNENPLIREQFESILAVAADDDDLECETVDDAEMKLVEKCRELGRNSMQQWAENKKKSRQGKSPPAL